MSNDFVCISITSQPTFSYSVRATGEVFFGAGTSQINFASVSVVNQSNGNHEIFLTDLKDRRVRIKNPIPVTISDCGDHILAVFSDAHMAVSEDTAAAVLDWMRSTISNTYLRYKVRKDILGPFAAEQLNVLERYVVEVQNSEGRG
jgi:hypothetical protein